MSLQKANSVDAAASGDALRQMEKFKNLMVVIISNGWRDREIDSRIGVANAVLHELYRSVVTKQDLSNTAKLSGFKSVFGLILTYGDEPLVVTENVKSQVQAAEKEFWVASRVLRGLKFYVRTRKI